MHLSTLCLAVTLANFAAPDHGWRRATPDLTRAEQTPDGLAIAFAGRDPQLLGPRGRAFPVPPTPGACAVFTLDTAPSDDIDEYQIFYSFADAPFDEHEKMILRPVDPAPPYTRYRAELAAPDATPGAAFRLRLDPPPGGARTAVLKTLDLSFMAPLWTPTPAVPPPFACTGARHTLDGPGWRLVQDGARLWAWALEADGQTVAESPGEEPVVYRDATGAVRTLAPAAGRVRTVPGGLETAASVRDADGTVWTIGRRFLTAADGGLDVRTRVATDHPVRLVHFPWLTVLADRASGGRKTQAVFPGVEYLADEPSSNELELRGRDARRWMPEPWRVCWPLMLLVRAEGGAARTLSLTWTREPGGRQTASPVFDTPDRLFRSGGHLFALWAPSVGAGRMANDYAVFAAQAFTGGEVAAHLTLGGETTAGAALGRLVTAADLPAPQEVPLAAFVDRVAPGWLGTHLGESGKWGPTRRVVADVASTLAWLAAHATGARQRAAFETRRRETQAACPPDGTERLGWGAQLYRWASPSGPFLQKSVRRLQQENEGHLTRMNAAWGKGYVTYRPAKGKPDYSAGWGATDVNGLSATTLLSLMRTAVWSGDEAKIAAALDAVRRLCERYTGTVPRGAQSWEMPLHTPDIMASAFLADTCALAYMLSGDAAFLAAAREWAQTGLAFVYLQEPRADHPPSVTDPYGLYATTAVLGASEWTLTNWIGRPVQWCGLTYARALLDLANVETDAARAAFWRRTAAGIAYSGLKQCYTADEPPYDGLLPDSFEPPSQRRHLGALGTRALIEAVGELRGEPIYYLTRPWADCPCLVHAPARLTAAPDTAANTTADVLRLDIAAWPQDPFEMLVTRIDKPAAVRLDGRPLTFDWTGRTLVIDLPPRAHGVLTIHLAAAASGVASADEDALSALFRSPPETARPEVWWHWMNGNVSREGIVADLDAMAAVGLGGVTIFDAGCAIPPGPLAFGTPDWFDTLKFAVAEAARRRLRVCLANCSGYSAAGGPWIAPSNAMKTVCYTLTDVEGPRRFAAALSAPPNPHGFYEDIAVLAWPVPAAERTTMAASGVATTVRTNGTREVVHEFAFPQPYRASLWECRLTAPNGWHESADAVLSRQTADGAWREVSREHLFAVEQGQTDPNLRAFPFPEAAARRWRLAVTFRHAPAHRYAFGDVRLSWAARLSNIANKALFVRTVAATRPTRADAGQIVRRADVRDLTAAFDAATGRLAWDVPPGAWRILRIGYAANGKTCHPASARGVGFECDKLAKAGVDAHFNAYLAKVCDHLGPTLAGAVPFGFNNVLVDSWEAGPQNWTQGFARTFVRRRGYDLTTWLPTLTGAVVDGVADTERFLADYRDVIAHLFAENFSDELARLCHARGLSLSLEAYGTFPSTPDLYGRAEDITMTEFWIRPDDPIDDTLVRLVTERAHRTPGGKIIGAESFTAFPQDGRWRQDPFALKATGDHMYALGVNRIIYHRYAHQPWTNPVRAPGMTMGAWGTHYERTVTWWYDQTEWIAYQTRCQALLQAGTFVDDRRDGDTLWTHRRYADGTEGFFVAQANPASTTVRVTLPVTGRVPEIWDPETGGRALAADWCEDNGGTRLSLAFKPSGAAFVMFRPAPTPGAAPATRWAETARRDVAVPWRVSFAAAYPDVPPPIVMTNLASLAEHADPEIRHFAGHATYRTTWRDGGAVRADGGDETRILLDLGDVRNLATVTVNGRTYPTLWRPPFRVDVTDAWRATNNIAVRVTTLWPNRLIGDEARPPDCEWKGNGLAKIPDWVTQGERSPTGRHAFATWRLWRKDDPLLPSGLIGPVRRLIETRVP